MINFSIIIPTYNYGHLISFAVDSIINQLNNDANITVEVIIIDDCSTDNTQQVLQSYKEYSFIKILSNVDNLGPAKSRNLAIKQATGEYILFLDADDRLTNNSLATINNFIKTNDYPDLILADHNNITQSNHSENVVTKTIKNNTLASSNTQRFKDYLFKKTISLTAGSVIFKKHIFEQIKFCEHLKINEDLPLFAQVLANFECKYLPFVTVNILKHHNSLRNNHILLNEAMNVHALTDIIFDEKIISAKLMPLKKHYLSLRYLSLFRSYYLAQQYQQARKFYYCSLRLRVVNIFKLNYLGKYFKSFILTQGVR